MKMYIKTAAGEVLIKTAEHNTLDEMLELMLLAIQAEGFVYIKRLEAIKIGEDDGC